LEILDDDVDTNRAWETDRGIDEFKKGYHPRTNLEKFENGDLLGDSHNILNWWKNYSKLLNIHRVTDVRQIEIHTAEPLVPEPSPSEVEFAIAKLKSINRQVAIKFRQN
jgi:hypothetical protein